MFMEKLKMGGNGKSFFALLGKTVDIKNPNHSEFVEKPIWLLSDQRHPEAVMKKACLLIFCSTFLPTYLPPYHSKYYGSQYCVKLIAIERKKERKHNIIRGKIVFVPSLYVSASARSYLGNISVERGTQVRTLNARFE